MEAAPAQGGGDQRRVYCSVSTGSWGPERTRTSTGWFHRPGSIEIDQNVGKKNSKSSIGERGGVSESKTSCKHQVTSRHFCPS